MTSELPPNSKETQEAKESQEERKKREAAFNEELKNLLGKHGFGISAAAQFDIDENGYLKVTGRPTLVDAPKKEETTEK